RGDDDSVLAVGVIHDVALGQISRSSDGVVTRADVERDGALAGRERYVESGARGVGERVVAVVGGLRDLLRIVVGVERGLRVEVRESDTGVHVRTHASNRKREL